VGLASTELEACAAAQVNVVGIERRVLADLCRMHSTALRGRPDPAAAAENRPSGSNAMCCVDRLNPKASADFKKQGTQGDAVRSGGIGI
jgi:hypothetical protein